MARKKKTDEAPADGAVEQDNAPGSPDEDAAPQAAASDRPDDSVPDADDNGSASDPESVEGGAGEGEASATPSDVPAASDDDDRGSDEGAEASDGAEPAPEEVDDTPYPFVDFVFATSNEDPGLMFVEVENPDGESIRVGEWIGRDDGQSALRIYRPDAEDVEIADADQVLFDALCGLAVRQDAELRQLRDAVEPFAKQVEDAEAKRGSAFARSNTVPISLGRLADLRDAVRFRALAPADADDEAILEAAQPAGSED